LPSRVIAHRRTYDDHGLQDWLRQLSLFSFAGFGNKFGVLFIPRDERRRVVSLMAAAFARTRQNQCATGIVLGFARPITSVDGK